jgi:hypothetical protein
MQGPSLFQVIVTLIPLVIAGGFMGYGAAASAGAKFCNAFVIAESLAMLTWLGSLVAATATHPLGSNAGFSTFLVGGMFAFLMFGVPGFLVALIVGAVMGWIRNILN